MTICWWLQHPGNPFKHSSLGISSRGKLNDLITHAEFDVVGIKFWGRRQRNESQDGQHKESPKLHTSRWDVGGKEGGNKVRVGRLTSAERCRSRIKMKAETRQRCQIRGRNNEGKTKELKHDECWWSQAGRSDAMNDTGNLVYRYPSYYYYFFFTLG